jgi:hypothetical protein
MNINNEKDLIIIDSNILFYFIKIIKILITLIQLVRYEAIHADLIKNLWSNSFQLKLAEKKHKIKDYFNM